MDVTELGEESVAASLRRLRKVEGQVRAVQRMIEEGRDCEEVLRQIAAAQKALKRVGVNLAVTGLEHCVLDDEGTPNRGDTMERFRRSFVELS